MTLLHPGDRFCISTRRMAASGVITKVNSVTIGWACDYQPAPNGPIHKLTGKIPLHEFKHALIVRGDVAFSIL